MWVRPDSSPEDTGCQKLYDEYREMPVARKRVPVARNRVRVAEVEGEARSCGKLWQKLEKQYVVFDEQKGQIGAKIVHTSFTLGVHLVPHGKGYCRQRATKDCEVEATRKMSPFFT